MNVRIRKGIPPNCPAGLQGTVQLPDHDVLTGQSAATEYFLLQWAGTHMGESTPGGKHTWE